MTPLSLLGALLADSWIAKLNLQRATNYSEWLGNGWKVSANVEIVAAIPIYVETRETAESLIRGDRRQWFRFEKIELWCYYVRLIVIVLLSPYFNTR